MQYPTVGVFDFFHQIYFQDSTFNIDGWKVLPNDVDSIDQLPDVFFQINCLKHKERNSDGPGHVLYRFIQQTGKPVLVCESSPFRRNITSLIEVENKLYYRLGWHHYLRCGNFNNKNSASDRWHRIQQEQQIEIKPWQFNEDGYVLLCLQKPRDSSLNKIYQNYDRYEDWIADTIDDIRTYTDRPILVRMHKKRKGLNLSFLSDYKDVSISKRTPQKIYEGGDSLQQDFEGAAVVVAYNSNVLVESVCEGIPSIALDADSQAWSVCNSLSSIETPDLSIDRTQWLYNLAYTTWLKEEILDGTAWNHLKSVYF